MRMIFVVLALVFVSSQVSASPILVGSVTQDYGRHQFNPGGSDKLKNGCGACSCTTRAYCLRLGIHGLASEEGCFQSLNETVRERTTYRAGNVGAFLYQISLK